MSRCESAKAICTTPSTLHITVEHAKAGTDSDDHKNQEEVAHYTRNDRYIMLGQMQLEMLIAALAENFLRLDDLGCQTVTVANALGAGASLDELWSNPELAQVPLFLDGIGSKHLEELRHGSFRQPFNVIVTGKDRSSPLA